MTRLQIERFRWTAMALITLHWLLTLPFSNIYLEGMWPPGLSEKPNVAWALGVVAVSLALGSVMLWFGREVRRTLTAAPPPSSTRLQPGSWAILGYGAFVITMGVFIATTLDPEVFNALRVPLLAAILVAAGILISAGALFLQRIRNEHLATEWKRLFLREG